MKKAWKGILGLLMAMTFTVSAGRMVYAETVDENHEVPDGVTVNGMELGGTRSQSILSFQVSAAVLSYCRTTDDNQ